MSKFEMQPIPSAKARGWTVKIDGKEQTVGLIELESKFGKLTLILEKRANMGDEPVWCAIGGFLNPGETHGQTQAREAAEESGLNAMTAEKLPGLPVNSNRAFFVADVASEGVRAYVLEIPDDMLEPDGDECWKLKTSALLPGFKKSQDVRFFEIDKAILRTADALALAAMAKLVVLMIR